MIKIAILFNFDIMLKIYELESIVAVEVSATEFCHQRGAFLDQAHSGSVILIKRHARPTAVLLSAKEYEMLKEKASQFEDAIWAEKALQAEKNMLSSSDSKALTLYLHALLEKK